MFLAPWGRRRPAPREVVDLGADVGDGVEAGLEVLGHLEDGPVLGLGVGRNRSVKHRAPIEAALEHDLSNALIESTNTKIRLDHRGREPEQAVLDRGEGVEDPGGARRSVLGPDRHRRRLPALRSS